MVCSKVAFDIGWLVSGRPCNVGPTYRAARGRARRRSRAYLRPMRIGIDLGGTKIEGIALSDSGAELARLRVPTPRDYDGSVDALRWLVRDLERATGLTGTVGIGIPGAVVPRTGLVKNANSVWLNGRPLPADLARALDRPVRMMNDANCFALSEATDGAAAGAEVVFGVILGTGVGGGIVVGGRCLTGPNLVAGEWGHNPLPWPTDDERPGAPCYCGQRGCIETFLSGPGLERDHAQTARDDRPAGVRPSSHEVVRAALDGDVAATATLARYRDRLGRALASVINLLDPDVIVLGGGLSNVPGIAEAAAAALPAHVFSDSVRTRVVRHVHGDSSGVRGAAWLWERASG
jgi:fructokinase